MKRQVSSILTIAMFSLQLYAAKPIKTVLDCRFDGPYYKAKNGDIIQKGCINNYEWGKKDISLRIHKTPSGASQMFEIRGIRTGAMQYFITGFSLRRGYYYKVTFKAKGEIDGNVSAKVRKIGKPWKTLIKGISFSPENSWKTYEFTGKAPTDIDGDIALCLDTGSIGRLWIDDVKVEEYSDPPDSVNINKNPLINGNIFPRSSFEGRFDYLWTSGIYAGPDGEWEDPQIQRVDGGIFGKYAMAIPTAKHAGTVFCRSFWLPVAAGHHYTFSIYLKSSIKRSTLKMAVLTRNGNRKIAFRKINVSDQWQRFTMTTTRIPADITDVYVSLSVPGKNVTILVDGVQMEAGKTASAYKPGYPCELYGFVTSYRSNILFWNDPLKISIRAATAIAPTSVKTMKTRIIVTAFPDHKVMDRNIELPLDQDYPLLINTNLNGLFRVSLSPVDKKSAAPQEILLARLPEPRKTGPESSFGTHITVRPFFIDYAKKIGIKWTRLHDASIITKWKGVEATQGKYRFYDTQIDALRAAGINILGLPDYPPAWAKQANKRSGNVIDLNAFKKLCTKLAEHYKGRIDYWEVWNEPYMKYFFAGNPAQYGEVLSIGADAIKKANPNAKILGFCTEINDIPYAEKIPLADRGKIDILSFHCYFQNIPGGGMSGYDKEVKRYLDFLKPLKPQEVWNTEGANRELGINSFYSFMPAAQGKLNERAAAFGARVWIEQIKGGIDKVFIYTLHQSDTIMYYGGYKKLIGFDRSITPAAVSGAVTAWCIDGLKNIKLPACHGIVEGLFYGNNRSCWIGFDNNTVPGNMILNPDKLPPEIKLLDVMGNKPGKDGKYIKIGIMPVFAVCENMAPERLANLCRKAISQNVPNHGNFSD